MIRCRVLGPVEVTVDGGSAPPELLWRKHLALLIYLACPPRRGRTREQLVGLLWADRPESQARHSLNEALRIIRRVAGEAAVASTGGRVKLADDTVTLDLEEFDRLMTAERPAEAAALAGGVFLEGFAVPGASAFEDWLAAERERWSRRMVEALVLSGTTWLARGGLVGAVDDAERALMIAPLAEPALRLLMSALAVRGDRAGALDRYDAFAARLEQALDAEPAPETQTLADRIRSQRSLAVTAETEASGATSSRRAPLAGREAELLRLVETWQECRRRGEARTVVLLGHPGTGKTRLAGELATRAALDGGRVATTRMVEADRMVSLSALLGLAQGGLLECAGIAAADPAALGAIGDALPSWRERFPSGAGSMELARAFREVVCAAAGEAPLILHVDDAQWADRDSWLTLCALPRDLARQPVVFLIAAASEPAVPELDQLRSHIPRDCPGLVLTLEPLGPNAIRQLARWALPSFGDTELDRVSRRIGTDSAGLPLLAVELLHAVALGLDLAAMSGAWPAPLHTLTDTLPADLPDAVRAALRVGFRRLTPAAQQVLMAAAVLAERETAERLLQATGLGQDELHSALDELEWQRWLEADGRGYSFVARIARAVVADDMVTAGHRQRIHAAVAGVTRQG
jgi:DNA-binding SARP family transcriptional activator